MKALLITFALFPAIAPAFAKESISDKIPPGQCSASPRAHKYSDVRIATVEVSKVDSCGFDFVNLEDNRVGADNFLQFSDYFCVTRTEADKLHASEYKTVRLPKKDLRKGMRGAAIYCSHCKTAFTVRLGSPNGSARARRNVGSGSADMISLLSIARNVPMGRSHYSG